MLPKIVVLLLIVYILYLLFFKKILKQSYKENDNGTKSSDEEFIECKKCSTFISTNEAIKSGNNYFCSKECLGGKK